MLRYIRRFLDCWRLARQIQRGELIAVRPGLLSIAVGQTQTLSYPVVQPEPPAVVAEESGESPDLPDIAQGKAWEVRLRTEDGRIKPIASGDDARAMMRLWNSTSKRLPSHTLELYDATTGVVRGTR